MAENVLRVLDSSGDLEIRWNTESESETGEARAMVADLKARGYSFFLVDGRAADEISAGSGALNCRRITAEELIPSLPDPNEIPPIMTGPDIPGVPPVMDEPAQAKRRGRKPGIPNRETVAVRPMRGG